MNRRVLRISAMSQVLVLLTVAQAAAQSFRAPHANPALQRRATVSVGALAGLVSASLTVPIGIIPIEGLEVSTGRRTGIAGGAFIAFRTGDRLTFETGALVVPRGFSLTLDLAGLGTATADLRILYVDVPALVSVRIARLSRGRVHLLAGPALGFKLGARVAATAAGQSQTQDFSSQVPATDVNLTIGGRADLARLLFDARYTHGLRNLAGGDSSGDVVTNRGFLLLVGWLF
jgi:Outer membrane protein beta-barrel domain